MSRNVIGLTLLCVLLLLCVAGPSLAQDAGPAKQRTNEELWADLLHYIRIGEVDLATSFSGKLLILIETGELEDRDVYKFCQNPKYKGSEVTLVKGKNLKGLSNNMSALLRAIERGYQAMRSDPDEITRAIDLLKGSLENYGAGRARLVASGEYALPQMIGKLVDVDIDPTFRSRLVSVLPAMGKNVIRGLSVALTAKDQKLVQEIAGVLRQIEYPHSVPRLAQALARKDLRKETRQALERALLVCGGKRALKTPVSQLFYEWAENYYAHNDSLLPDIRLPQASVWYWKEGLGVESVPVPREVLCYIYSMRMARLALAHNPENHKAVPLWLCAAGRRELDLREGTKDPILTEDKLQAGDFILATSPQYLQRALSRALAEKNSPLVMMMIQGLAETTPGATLFADGSDAPLVKALQYPDRRVRFQAAISLARSLPANEFDGVDIALDVLIRAIRQRGKITVVAIGVDNTQKDVMRETGYGVLFVNNTDQALLAADKSAGVDGFILGSLPTADKQNLQAKLSKTKTLSNLPVVSLAELERQNGAKPDADTIKTSLVAAKAKMSGKIMAPNEAASWASRACRVLERLCDTENKVYDLLQARGALIEALGHESKGVQADAINALAVMNDATAQQAVVSFALGNVADEKLAITAFNALSRSLRRFGYKLTSDQSQDVIRLVIGKTSTQLRTAASRALGAMNLPSQEIKQLILTAEND